MFRSCSPLSIWRRSDSDDRRGAATVEMAVVVPVFGIFLAALVEFGHAYMVLTTLRGAAKKAARLGVAEQVSTSDVRTRALEVVEAGMSSDHVTVMIKDASMFDAPEVDATSIEFDDLPAIELDDAEPRQLFLVRLEVPYDQVALFPPFWVTDTVIHSQSVMRHE